MLHKQHDEPWTEEELRPVQQIVYHEIAPSGSPLGATLTLRGGRTITVDFAMQEGQVNV